MANKAKITKTRKGNLLNVVNPDSAGIDIGDYEIQVCVPAERDDDNNRTFGTFTCELRDLVSYLKACGIKTVAMEATGVYFVSLYMMLQQEGFEVLLANPHDVRKYVDKKTDASDAEWLMTLCAYGLITPCFQPENVARKIRNLCRHRNELIQSAARETQHMQKAMQLMNIKLDTVISDITGKSGTSIIEAILSGNHAPESLAALADRRCKASKETIAKSLEGTWDEDHMLVLKQSRSLYCTYQSLFEEVDAKIGELLEQYDASIDRKASEVKLDKRQKRKSKNAPRMDIESYANSIWSVNVMAIPGLSANVVMQLIGELGHNFTDKFETAGKFCRWLNLAPDDHISGGKVLSSHLSKRKNPAGQMIRQVANSLHDAKDEMGIYYRRMKSRLGGMMATIATAHKIAKILYVMVKFGREYDGTKVGLDEKELLERKIERMQRKLSKLEDKYKKAC